MDISGKAVLVTGGAGFIGSYVVDLLARDNRVTVLDDFSIGERAALDDAERTGNVRVVEGDIRDEQTVADCAAGADVVFHMAAASLRRSLSDPLTNHEINATGTLIVLEAARAAGVRRFVYVSSSEAYGTARERVMDEQHPQEPTTVYGAAKLAGEAYARAYFLTYELPTVIVRPFNAYGPRAHLVGPAGEVIPRFVIFALAGRAPVIFGTGEQTRDFTYVSDTARGIILAGACDELVGDVANIGTGRETSIRDLAQAVLRAVGREDIEPVHEDARPGDVDRHCADISKASRLTGYAPQVDLGEGIARYVEWFKSQGHDHKRLLSQIDVRNW